MATVSCDAGDCKHLVRVTDDPTWSGKCSLSRIHLGEGGVCFSYDSKLARPVNAGLDDQEVQGG